MREGMIIILLASGPLLWMLGGWKWKGWRRIVWPVVCGVCSVLSGVSIVRVILLALGISGTAMLPYGDQTPWWRRVLTFACYPIPTLAISTHTVGLFVGLSAVLLSLLFWLSRKYNQFTWKIWEAFAGLLQAAAIVASVL